MPDNVHDTPQAKNPPVWKSRGDTRLEKFGKDPYEERHQPPSPARCPECEAVFQKGRWAWVDEVPDEAQDALCPACRRARDNYPAGHLLIEGAFLSDHRDEIINLVRNVETLENGDHPLHRILELAEEGDTVTITTTDIHLPRRIGESLHRAYQGEFDYHYEPNEHVIRGRWSRD
jgi:hypothetical protein